MNCVALPAIETCGADGNFPFRVGAMLLASSLAGSLPTSAQPSRGSPHRADTSQRKSEAAFDGSTTAK